MGKKGGVWFGKERRGDTMLGQRLRKVVRAVCNDLGHLRAMRRPTHTSMMSRSKPLGTPRLDRTTKVRVAERNRIQNGRKCDGILSYRGSGTKQNLRFRGRVPERKQF